MSTETPETTTEVPAELIKVAMDAYDVWSTGHIHRDMPHVLAAVIPAVRADERAKVAEELRADADAHRRLIARKPGQYDEARLARARTLDDAAARIARGEQP